MKIILSGGREVEVNRPSVRDRIRCGDMQSVSFEVTGMTKDNVKLGHAITKGTKEATFNWAAAGLGVELEGLDQYSDSEIMEIGAKVKELAELNPTKEPS